MTIKTKSLRTIRRESRERRDAAVASAFSKAFFRPFEIDSKGRKVRVTSHDDRCTREDVQLCLRNQRAVTEEEVLEQCGRGALENLLAQGYIVRAMCGPHASIPADYFYVTKKAAAAYRLPRPSVGNFVL